MSVNKIRLQQKKQMLSTVAGQQLMRDVLVTYPIDKRGFPKDGGLNP